MATLVQGAPTSEEFQRILEVLSPKGWGNPYKGTSLEFRHAPLAVDFPILPAS